MVVSPHLFIELSREASIVVMGFRNVSLELGKPCALDCIGVGVIVWVFVAFGVIDCPMRKAVLCQLWDGSIRRERIRMDDTALLDKLGNQRDQGGGTPVIDHNCKHTAGITPSTVFFLVSLDACKNPTTVHSMPTLVIIIMINRNFNG